MILIGTSGFQYPEWKGGFYPEDMSPARMLSYYAERFSTTEINYTFRQLPSDQTLANWIAQTPDGFRFTLKALQRITDHRRLKNCEELLRGFVAAANRLGSKRGALLFQLPPNFKCDVPVLEDFLALLPPGSGAAFEFRHSSWFIDPVFEALCRHNAALCLADSEDLTTPTVFTSTTAYFRLRRVNYSRPALGRWAEIIGEQSGGWKDTWVYFKHEEAGTGPRLAKQLIKMLGLETVAARPAKRSGPSAGKSSPRNPPVRGTRRAGGLKASRSRTLARPRHRSPRQP
jgi:uncharacterized protein YecE (DUF72 family)